MIPLQSNASADLIIAPTLCGSVIPSKARIIGFAELFLEKLINSSRDIVLEHAKTVNANLEITDLVNSFYENIQNSGGGRWDTSSLLRRLES